MIDEYANYLCDQCDQKFLMKPDGFICHQCRFKHDAIHYQRGVSDTLSKTNEWMDNARMTPDKFARYGKLLAFVNGLAEFYRDIDTALLWKNIKTAQDGIDYTEHYLAKLAKELLEGMGEWKKT